MNQPHAPRSLPGPAARSTALGGAQTTAKAPAGKAPNGTSAGYLSQQAAPMPAPAPAPVAETVEARDPIFFHAAMVRLTSVLLAPSVTVEAADEKLALDTAEAIARLFDSGTAPDGFIAPERMSEMVQWYYYNHHAGPNTPIKSNEGEKQIRFQQLQQQERTSQTKVKTADQAKLENEQALAAIRDISEPVRAEALAYTVQRLSALPKITGFHKDEAIGVAVQGLLMAIRLAEKCSVPARGLQSTEEMKEMGEIDPEVAKRVVPYPGSAALEISMGALQAVLEENTQPDQETHGEAAAEGGE